MATQDILKEDLLTLDPKAFYLKHIVKSHNWYFSDYLHFAPDEIVDKMDFFKEVVSTNLGINFHSMQIVGSAKTGYSLSPKKVLQPFHNRDGKIAVSYTHLDVYKRQLFSRELTRFQALSLSVRKT